MEKKAEIIYKDEDILVLNKRAGVVCTKEGREEKETLEDWLAEEFGKNTLLRWQPVPPWRKRPQHSSKQICKAKHICKEAFICKT
jgi:23S rRNA-/tRNA-specific pseudouridylate synthase